MDKVKLGDIAVLINGDRGKNYPSQADITGDGEVPFVNAGHLNGKSIDFEDMNYISLDKYEQLNSGKFEKGDVLYCLRGSLGKKAIVNDDIRGAIASSLVIIRPDHTRIDSNYLLLALDSPSIKEQLVKANNGSSQPNLSATSVRKYQIELPDMVVQKNVVKKLLMIRSVIDRRQQELSLLDELIKARFVEMFGDPNANNMNWEMGIINDIGKCVAGATPSTAKPEYWENGTIPWLSSGEVNKGRIYETDAKITQQGYDNASTKMVPAKTVVLAMAGQGKTRGTAAITEIELCTNQSICSIVNNEKVNHEYLLAFLRMQYKELRKASTSAEGRGGLNLKIIGSYHIMIPPLKLQNQFSDFVTQIDKSKFMIRGWFI